MMSNEVEGILKRNPNQVFTLRLMDRSLRPGPKEIMVPGHLVQKYKLVQGTCLSGTVEKKGGKSRLTQIDRLCGLDPAIFMGRTSYAELTAVDPTERFDLGSTGQNSLRMVDLIAPMGKGTRQLIVSPPKAGKTVLLEQMAQSLRQQSPQSHIMVLLVDERPEEVTGFKRAVEGVDILSSTSDHSADEHCELAELVLSHTQVELECGKDVILLIDSLTRLGRAFNNRRQGRTRQRGHTMSGGLEAGILEIPRRLFGLARRIENGGSVTIIATCLVDTGSRMDQLIFEEFKGTGNSEIVLDRSLAEARIFPAINIAASGTRKEMHLYSEHATHGLMTLRRVISNYSPKEAIGALQKLLTQYPTNEDFLDNMTVEAH
jgi:transcription termination factor Rho